MRLVGAEVPNLDLKARGEKLPGVEGVRAVSPTYFSLEDQKTEGERG